jgi:hypothetical protein
MIDGVLIWKQLIDRVYLSSFVSTKTRKGRDCKRGNAEAKAMCLKRLDVDERERSSMIPGEVVMEERRIAKWVEQSVRVKWEEWNDGMRDGAWWWVESEAAEQKGRGRELGDYLVHH